MSYNIIREQKITINNIFYKILVGKVSKVWEVYNSFNYWENVISRNKTIRGHMFMQKPPTERSIYFHTLIFGNNNGINNIWGYFPNRKCLIGYLQYSFLQEAFYKWIYGKEKLISAKILSQAISSLKNHLKFHIVKTVLNEEVYFVK